MVKIRRDGNNTTWVLEEESLAGRLRELSVIFKHHSKHSHDDRMDPRFFAETLAIQTEALADMAERQEKTIERLKTAERDLEALREEFRAEMQKLREPACGKLEKPAAPRGLPPPSKHQ